MVLISKIKTIKLYNYSIILYILNTFLLLIILILGKEVNGTKAWFRLFNISIQPSEFMKINLILINSYIINKYYKNKDKIKNEFKLIITILCITIIPSILTFLEPDTGAIICYFIISISMLYISGINKKWFITLFIIIFIFLGIIFYLYFFKESTFIRVFGNSLFYRIDRVLNWKSKSGIQLNNSLIAIGSAGLFGHNKVPLYYPEAGTDFIFTSFTSSYGFIGGTALLLLFLLFNLYLLKSFKYIKRKQDIYTLFGIVALLFYQEIQNISMTIGLLPISGITLPFISYGGSSIISCLILMGIVISIKKRKKA